MIYYPEIEIKKIKETYGKVEISTSEYLNLIKNFKEDYEKLQKKEKEIEGKIKFVERKYSYGPFSDYVTWESNIEEIKELIRKDNSKKHSEIKKTATSDIEDKFKKMSIIEFIKWRNK